jgi:hypothetical protein
MKRALLVLATAVMFLSALMVPTLVRADGPIVSSGGGKPPILLR